MLENTKVNINFQSAIKVQWSVFLVLTLAFPGEGITGNPKFGSEVDKVWSKIVPAKIRTQIIPNEVLWFVNLGMHFISNALKNEEGIIFCKQFPQMLTVT
jgi:hypothetical protein